MAPPLATARQVTRQPPPTGSCEKSGLDDLGQETVIELLAHVGLNHDDIRDALHRALTGLVRDAAWFLDERAKESNMPDHLRAPLRRVRQAIQHRIHSG